MGYACHACGAYYTVVKKGDAYVCLGCDTRYVRGLITEEEAAKQRSEWAAKQR